MTTQLDHLLSSVPRSYRLQGAQAKTFLGRLTPGQYLEVVAIYALGDRVPDIDDTAFVHPDATVIGSVRLGPRSSVWPHAVVRGDYGTVTVGEATSIQDGAVIHCTARLDTTVGNWVVVGHLAHLEGCVVEDRALIGVGSVVLHQARIGKGATVGAGAVVTNNLEVPPEALAVGVPAVVKPGRSDPTEIARMGQVYVDNTTRYRIQLRRIDEPAPQDR